MTNLKALVTEVDSARRTVEALKIEVKVNDGDICDWNDAITEKLEEADGHIENLEEWLANKKMEAEKQEREEKMQFEIKLHETKLKLQEDLQIKAGNLKSSVETSVGEAKLPKLIITKFNGTYADWPRSWGQYSETIDKTNVPPVTKFTYLRELLDTKVRKTVEALPYSAEGYNRAVAILKDRFGKQSEIVKAYVKEILELPYTPTGNPKRIHEFHNKLSHSVQSLETLHSLHEVNGMVSLTLDKWKVNHPTLPTNEAGSKRRLEQLVRKLERNGQYEEYDSIIQEQPKEGIVEPAPEVATGREFYIPHKGVTRENAESTKLRIVYDASAKEKENQPSLNDCLNLGPPLQTVCGTSL